MSGKHTKAFSRFKNKKEFVPEFDGHNPNYDFEGKSKNLPKSIKTAIDKKKFIIEEKTRPILRDEEQKKDAPVVNPEKDHPEKKYKNVKIQQRQEELIPLPVNFVESFKLSIEKSCRGRFRLSSSLPIRMASSYVRFLNDKKMLYGFEDLTNMFNVGTIFGAVAQIVGTQGHEVKYAFPGLEKLCKIDIHLPIYLCSVLKTLGNFDCEYGRFEVERPLSTIFHMLSDAYRFHPANYDIKVFKALKSESNLLPWNSEGFKFFKDKAIGALETYSRDIAGLKVLIPLPEPSQTKVEYLATITGWTEGSDAAAILNLVNFIFMNEFEPFKDYLEVNGFEFRFITRDVFREISEWFGVVAKHYKNHAQSDVIKVFDCEKFVPTAQGNACQLVSRNDETQLVESRFLLPTADATLGAVFSYCEELTLVGDFAGIVTKDAVVQYMHAVQQGLERRYIL